jgi:hypothetical protein
MGLDGGGSIVLAHDSQENTAGRLVGRMIGEVKRRGLNGMLFFDLILGWFDLVCWLYCG